MSVQFIHVWLSCSLYLTIFESLQMICNWNISLHSTLSISLRGTCRGRQSVWHDQPGGPLRTAVRSCAKRLPPSSVVQICTVQLQPECRFSLSVFHTGKHLTFPENWGVNQDVALHYHNLYIWSKFYVRTVYVVCMRKYYILYFKKKTKLFSNNFKG